MMTLLKYTTQAARRREPTVGQEAVSTRSRKRRPVRSQWSPPRQGRLKTACCLSARGVATAKQRFDRAVGTAGAPFSKYTKIHPFINEIKSHPEKQRIFGVCPRDFHERNGIPFFADRYGIKIKPFQSIRNLRVMGYGQKI